MVRRVGNAHSVLLGAVAVVVMIGVWFATSTPSSTAPSNHDGGVSHNDQPDVLHQLPSPRTVDDRRPQRSAITAADDDATGAAPRAARSTARALSPNTLVPLSGCQRGGETPLSRHAAATALSARLRDLCGSHCASVPADRAPSGAAPDWQPQFCKASSAGVTAPRFDHGCYTPATAAAAAGARGGHADGGGDGGGDGGEGGEGEAAAPACPTAVFSAFGNRFYGPGGQEYVWESIRQWRVFHPHSAAAASSLGLNCRVFVIVNEHQLHGDVLVRRNATALHAELVSIDQLRTPQWRRYDRVFYVQGYMHPGGDRKTGHKLFNKLVSERFFAIESLMRTRGLRHVVCLENDMMVYTNFADTVRAVANCGWRVASIFPHLKGVIPGIMYVNSASDMARFASFLNDLLSCGKAFGEALQRGYANDMTYLMNFYQLHGGAWMGDLPNGASGGARSGPRAGDNCVADQLPWLLHDGASFGQWYSFAVKGSAPLSLPKCASASAGDEGEWFTSGCRAWEGALADLAASAVDGSPVSEARPPKHIANAMRGRFVDATPGELVRWRRDAQGRRVPVWGSYQLSSLHVHAKNLYWFRSK